MSNVANLELCKELYEVSGWGDVELWHDWGKVEGASRFIKRKWEANELNSVPAYDLGYLIRKLQPENVSVHPMGDGKRWYADNMGGGGQNYQSRTADTPEDALCALAIELFKQGVLL